MRDEQLGEQFRPMREGAAVRVLVADDQAVFLAGVRATLEADGGFEIVGLTSSGPRVFPLVGQLEPDVVLMDVRMSGIDGIDCLDRVVARHPQVKVIMCSAIVDAQVIEAAFRHGACGYIVKTIASPDLGAAIRQAVDGTAFHAVGQSALGDESPAREAGLTDRELEIMRAVTRGLPNKAVGAELWITEQTVKFHLTNVYRKLGIRNRIEAARWTIGQGLEERADLTTRAA